MRVAIAGGGLGGLSPWETTTALASAWADETNADVAVVPFGEAGGEFLRAFAQQHAVETTLCLDESATGEWVRTADTVAIAGQAAPDGEWDVASSSLPLGLLAGGILADVGEVGRVVIDLAGARHTHDAGAGLLCGLGARADVPLDLGTEALEGVTSVNLALAREFLGEAELVGVIPYAEREQRLLGLRGISAQRGHLSDAALEKALAWDRALERFASVIGPDAATAEGAGACGGAALAILALGGRIATGPQFLAEVAGFDQTLAAADLIVTCVDQLDFVHRGGGVVHYLAGACQEAGVPLVVVARENHVSNRELRTFGVEAGYGLDVRMVTPAQLVDLARPIARSWRW